MPIQTPPPPPLVSAPLVQQLEEELGAEALWPELAHLSAGESLPLVDAGGSSALSSRKRFCGERALSLPHSFSSTPSPTHNQPWNFHS
jgi:hypothetical protein